MWQICHYHILWTAIKNYSPFFVSEVFYVILAVVEALEVLRGEKIFHSGDFFRKVLPVGRFEARAPADTRLPLFPHIFILKKINYATINSSLKFHFYPIRLLSRGIFKQRKRDLLMSFSRKEGI